MASFLLSEAATVASSRGVLGFFFHYLRDHGSWNEEMSWLNLICWATCDDVSSRSWRQFETERVLCRGCTYTCTFAPPPFSIPSTDENSRALSYKKFFSQRILAIFCDWCSIFCESSKALSKGSESVESSVESVRKSVELETRVKSELTNQELHYNLPITFPRPPLFPGRVTCHIHPYPIYIYSISI